MRNALGAVQSLLVLGGTSDIGAAIAERLVRDGCTTVVLAARRPDAAETVADRLRTAGATSVETVEWDALNIGAQGPTIDGVFDAHGDIDCVLVAAAVLGDQEAFERDPEAAAEAMTANYTGPASALLHVARRLRAQGHGAVVVLSSVAAERARRGSYVYSSSKAALDSFTQGLSDSLVGSGARVLLVRPGFVHSRMTEGRDPQPLATTPEAVADAVAAALASGRETVWVPGPLRWVMSALRHLPRPLWRRVSTNR